MNGIVLFEFDFYYAFLNSVLFQNCYIYRPYANMSAAN